MFVGLCCPSLSEECASGPSLMLPRGICRKEGHPPSRPAPLPPLCPPLGLEAMEGTQGAREGGRERLWGEGKREVGEEDQWEVSRALEAVTREGISAAQQQRERRCEGQEREDTMRGSHDSLGFRGATH